MGSHRTSAYPCDAGVVKRRRNTCTSAFRPEGNTATAVATGSHARREDGAGRLRAGCSVPHEPPAKPGCRVVGRVIWQVMAVSCSRQYIGLSSEIVQDYSPITSRLRMRLGVRSHRRSCTYVLDVFSAESLPVASSTRCPCLTMIYCSGPPTARSICWIEVAVAPDWDGVWIGTIKGPRSAEGSVT